MYQLSVSTPSKHAKEKLNPKNVDTEIDLSEVVTDVAPLSIALVHATPIRKARISSSWKGKPSKISTSSSPSMNAKNVKTLETTTVVKKPHSMISLYLDPISVEPNVGVSKDYPVMPNVMEDLEASKTSHRSRFVTTLSKSNMIVVKRDDVNPRIFVY